MSLENAINELTAAVNSNNELIRQMLAADEAKGGGEDKPKATRKKADTKGDTGTEDAGKADTTGTDLTADLKALKGDLASWLGEFAKEEDKDKPEGAHPEVTARKEALQKAYAQLGVKSLKEVTTAEQIEKIKGWLKKAKGIDKGHGAGRFVADPVETTDEDEDDLSV